MAIQIQLRRGLASEWTSANPILADGEVGYEKDTRKEKVGDGVTAWTSLPYKISGNQDLTPYQLKPSEGEFENGDKTKLDGITAGATPDQDISGIATNASAITNKQDTLVSGTNIKTINGESLLGSSDITVTDTVYDDSDVLKDSDSLTAVTPSNKLMTQSDVAGLGGGDMLSSAYDPIINLNTAKVGVTNEEANPDVVGQAEAEAGTSTTERTWTAERVKQAIAALGGSGGVSDAAYSISWNGVTSTAPSKNALYDFIESQVFKVDENSKIVPIFWGGTQAEYNIDFPSGHTSEYFVVVTDAVTDIEGTAVLSTGEVGNIKFLGEDGDNTSSWKQVTSSNILNTPSGNQTNTNLQLVINDLQTQIDTLNATLITPPIAAFSGTPLSINETETVTYTDASTNTPTSWSWVFEGGTPATSTVQNPTVTYNTAGTYDVTLTATNAGGSDTEAKVDYVTVAAAANDLFPSGNTLSAVEVNANPTWTAISGSVTESIVSDVAATIPSGTLSQRLEMNNTTTNKSAWYDLNVVAGTEYTITWWMKRDATDTSQRVTIEGEWSGGADEAILATTTWTEYTRTVTPSVSGLARILFTPAFNVGVIGVGINVDHVTITY